MVLDDQVTGDRRICRRRKGRRRWIGSEFAATPSREWKLWGGDSGRGRGGEAAVVSARKLAAELWRLAATADASGRMRWQCGAFDRFRFQLCSSMPTRKFAMEEITKWDYSHSKVSDDVISYFHSHWKHLKSGEIATTSVASARQAELSKARKHIDELEADHPKIKYRMKKFNEERAPWTITEKESICLIIKNLKDAVKKERRNCKRINIANAELLRDIDEAKLSARKFMKNIEKEKKAREFLEDVCNKLAKEIQGNKHEIDTLRNQRNRIQEEVEEAKKMLQIAQVWREERAQMKLVDAKLILENKYAEVNNLIIDLEALLKSSNSTTDVNLLNKAEILRKVFDPVKIQGTKEFPPILPKSINKSTIFKNFHTNEADGWIHHIDPKANDTTTKRVCSNGLTSGGSGKETVTQAEIHPDRTAGEGENSVNKIRSSKNANYESQKSESSKISSVKLGSSKPQRTMPRNKTACKEVPIDGSRSLSNISLSSTVSIASSQRVLGEGALGDHDTACQWPASEHINPHVVRAMKGHIEWPRGTRKNSLATNLLEAKLESQKMLLRNVLKQKS